MELAPVLKATEVCAQVVAASELLILHPAGGNAPSIPSTIGGFVADAILKVEADWSLPALPSVPAFGLLDEQVNECVPEVVVMLGRVTMAVWLVANEPDQLKVWFGLLSIL